MSGQTATSLFDVEMDEGALLSWENLGSQPASRAFRQSLRELVLHPARFFDRMATTGGLHEPLAFFWLVAGACVLLSFPLALSYFGLTAPDAARVPTEVYNAHLLMPRLTGFLAILLPLTLVVLGIQVVVLGSLLAVGGRFFGARSWEASVSVCAYCCGAALVPAAAATGLAAGICTICYVATVLWPGVGGGAASLARIAVYALPGVASVLGVMWALVLLFVGCGRSLGLGAVKGSATAIVGLILSAVLYVGIPVGWRQWKAPGAIAAVAILAAVIVLSFIISLAAESARTQRADT